MDALTVGDVLLFCGIISLAGLAAVVTTITRGVSYKKTRRIPPYKNNK